MCRIFYSTKKILTYLIVLKTTVNVGNQDVPVSYSAEFKTLKCPDLRLKVA